MPELPEVETVRRGLAPVVTGRVITAVTGLTFPGVMGPGGLDRSDALLGRVITGVSRRGKYLSLDLDDDTALVVHLRMTGQLVASQPGAPPLRFQHLTVALADPANGDDGQSQRPAVELRFADQRKFGRVLHTKVSARDAMYGLMGPEPLGDAFTDAALAAELAGRRAPIKSALLDQRRVAGLGNIYVDEALFRAGIHPLRPAGSLDEAAVTRLRVAIQEVLEESLARRGTTFSSFLDGYGDPGENGANLRVYGRGRRAEPCVVCGTPLQMLKVAGRTTTYCPVCQPA